MHTMAIAAKSLWIIFALPLATLGIVVAVKVELSLSLHKSQSVHKTLFDRFFSSAAADND